MDTNNEEWKDAAAEGSSPQTNDENKSYRNENFARSEGARPHRPRIQREVVDRRPVYQKRYADNSDYNSEERPSYNRERSYYNRPYNNAGDNEGYSNTENSEYRSHRPRMNTNYSTEDRPYRPRYNNQDPYNRDDNRSYVPRNNYGRGNSYGERNNYGERTNNYGGRNSYTSRPNYGERGGYDDSERRPYRPRYTNQQGGYGNNNYGGGYNRSPRPGYNPNAKYSLKKQIEYKELNVDLDAPIRLNRFLANAGICSRREADEFIQAGVVSVNGAVVSELGTKVKRTDEIKFHEQPVSMERKVYVLLNKPKDCVTTVDDPQDRKTVMDLIKNACKERIYPVGRLDRNTTGVLLLTNDGELASKLTHPKFLKKKVYQVTLDRVVNREDLDKIATGISLEDGDIQADAVGYSNEMDRKQVGIEIHSGKNRIVRRIFESLGYRVTKLDRVLFAGLTKKGLRRGDWRYLTEPEVNMLRMGAFE